jgi:hypothetical protein
VVRENGFTSRAPTIQGNLFMANHDSSRRKFLKGVGIAGAGAAIAYHLWTEADA